MKSVALLVMAVIGMAHLAHADGTLPTYIAGKPAYFVEGIAASGQGRPRIDTGYVFKKEPRVVSTIRIMEDADADIAGMPDESIPAGTLNICAHNGGAYSEGGGGGPHFQYRYGGAVGSLGRDLHYGTNTVANVGALNCDMWYAVDFGREVYLNGRLLGRFDSFDFSANEQTFSLFSGRSGRPMVNSAWRETWIYDGGVLVRHLKPAVTAAGAACMYDTITDRCYINVGNTYAGESSLVAQGEKSGIAIKKFVEYLSADSGNCKVSTGYAFTDRPRVRTTMKLMTTSDMDIMGASKKEGFIVNFDDSRQYCWSHLKTGQSATVRYGASILNQWVVGDFSDQAFLTDAGGTAYRATCATNDYSANTLPFALYSGRNSPAVAFKAVEIYDGLDAGGNWKLVMYLKPAVDEDDNPCFYDTLSGRCFYNSGSGTLTVGPDRTDLLPPAVSLDWVGDGYVAGHDVDTGYAFTNQPLVKTSAYLAEQNDKDIAGTPEAAAGCFIIDYNLNPSANCAYYRYGTSGANIKIIDKVLGQWTDFIWGEKIVHDDGRYVSSSCLGSSVTFANNAQTFHLFRGRSASFTGTRFRRTQMFDGFALSSSAKPGRQTLVRDLVPVKDSNGVACFYDAVEGRYYHTSKSGAALAAGPAVSNCAEVVASQARSKMLLTDEYVVVASRKLRLKDVVGASAETDVQRSAITDVGTKPAVLAMVSIVDDSDNEGERIVEFQQYSGGYVASALVRLKDDGVNIYAKIDAKGAYPVATNGLPVAIGRYSLRTDPDAFTDSASEFYIRGLTLWAVKSEIAVDATVDGFQARVADGATVRLDGEGTMSGWLAGHGDARIGSGEAAKETVVEVGLTATPQKIAEATPLYAVSSVGWGETSAGVTRRFEKDGSVIEFSQVDDDIYAALISGDAPASLTLATAAQCVTSFGVTNSIVGELAVDGAYVKISTSKAIAPNTGSLVVRAGGVCELPDLGLSGDGQGLGYDYVNATDARQRIVVEEGGRLVVRSKAISSTTTVDVDGGELTVVANDDAKSSRVRINYLNLGDGAKVTGDGIVYMGATCSAPVLWSHGSAANVFCPSMKVAGSGVGLYLPLRIVADADLKLGGAVSMYGDADTTALVKLGSATMEIAANVAVPLDVEDGAVVISANQASAANLTLAGVSMTVSDGVSASYGTLAISGENTLTLGEGASLAVSTLGSWAEGTALKIVADDPANISLRLPVLTAGQLAAITCPAKPRWHAVQDADGYVRFPQPGLILFIR